MEQNLIKRGYNYCISSDFDNIYQIDYHNIPHDTTFIHVGNYDVNNDYRILFIKKNNTTSFEILESILIDINDDILQIIKKFDSYFQS